MIAVKLWYGAKLSLRSREEGRTTSAQTCTELTNTPGLCSPGASYQSDLRKGSSLSCHGLDQGVPAACPIRLLSTTGVTTYLPCKKWWKCHLSWPPFLYKGLHYSSSHLCVPKQYKPPTGPKLTFVGLEDCLVYRDVFIFFS